MLLTQASIIQRFYHYGRLMRLHRPAGKVLLLWPTLMALFFASDIPSLKLLIIFTLGTWLMSCAGCVINDFADRNFDEYVERTKERPIVTGNVTAIEALGLFAFLLCIAFSLVCTTNLKTVELSVVALLLAFIYPFSKRYIHFPQVILGAAYGWAIPMAYSAQDHSLSLDCWGLFTATVLWAVAYDTQYAMADKEEDLKIGIKSTAIYFGQYDKCWIGVSHFLMLALLTLVGVRLQLGLFYYIGILVAGAFVLYQQWLIKDRTPQLCLRAFLNNQWLGAVLFVGTVLDKML